MTTKARNKCNRTLNANDAAAIIIAYIVDAKTYKQCGEMLGISQFSARNSVLRYTRYLFRYLPSAELKDKIMHRGIVFTAAEVAQIEAAIKKGYGI